MAINRGQAEGDWRCFNYGGFGHMAQNYNSGRIVERNRKMIQTDKEGELKDDREQ